MSSYAHKSKRSAAGTRDGDDASVFARSSSKTDGPLGDFSAARSSRLATRVFERRFTLDFPRLWNQNDESVCVRFRPFPAPFSIARVKNFIALPGTVGYN